jgi:short-subunit dehydrogenase
MNIQKKTTTTQDFTDKVILITGAATGLGKSLLTELCRRGAIVIACDVHYEKLRLLMEEVLALGGRGEAKYADVSNLNDMEQLIDYTVKKHEHIDYIFNNAGIAIVGAFEASEIADWERILRINLLGVLHGTMLSYRHMVKQAHGHIVNIASLAGLIDLPLSTPYSMTKHGVVGLTTGLYHEAKTKGVFVSVVCPGFIQSDIFQMGTVVGASNSHSLTQLPIKKISSDAAAKLIINGVIRREKIIVVPFSARLIWWLYRYLPGAFNILAKQLLGTLTTSFYGRKA